MIKFFIMFVAFIITLFSMVHCNSKGHSSVLLNENIPMQNIFHSDDRFTNKVLKPNLSSRGDCFERDVNYQGEDINDGLMLLTASASECQDNCRVNADCNDFTWADPDSFPDSSYHNSCWMKKAVALKNSQVGAVSGPKTCDDPNGCCNTLTFKSTGSLADGGQSHLLGQYDYVDEGPDGTKIYHQPGHGGGDPEVWLYFIGGLFDQWFISNNQGYNGGYAWIADDDQCPETLSPKWEWYNSHSDSMVLDETAAMECGGPDPTVPPPPPNCCHELVFESTGGMNHQKHVLGSYDYHSVGEVGTNVYRHTDRGEYLYYLEWLGLWYIGDTIGENLGYAMNQDDRKCPEELAKQWKYADGADWTLDDVANMRCR